MKAALYILLVLFSLSLLFLCFTMFLYHASGHNIPVKTDLGFAALILVNIGLIWFLWGRIKKIKQ
jgi:cbb3-type cytochrome oxidase subunit 3